MNRFKIITLVLLLLIAVILTAVFFINNNDNIETNLNIKPAENSQLFILEKIIVDSDYLLEEALTGKDIPDMIKNSLVIVDVEYFSFDNKLHKGEIVIHKELEKDIEAIFRLMKEKKFPIEKAVPIVKYNWSDEESMKDNNTSAFNYRVVKGTQKFSAHAQGRALDINPFLNPQIKREKVIPAGAEYDPAIPGTITGDSFIVNEFRKLGWVWGGSWKSTKDYQHFEKLKR